MPTLALTYPQAFAFSVFLGVLLILSGVFGLVARKKVDGHVSRQHAFGPVFRLAGGVGILVFVVVHQVAT